MRSAYRFFVDAAAIDFESRTVRLEKPEQVSQIVRVLRLAEGAAIDILDGAGKILHCRLSKIDSKGRSTKALTLAIEQVAEAGNEPVIDLVVALPVLRASRFEWALEKLTEIGATIIVPVELERSRSKEKEGGGNGKSWSAVTRDDGTDSEGKISPKMSRWRAIARESAEQCERALIPDVVEPVTLPRFLESPHCQTAMLKIVAAERSGATPLASVIEANLHAGKGTRGDGALYNAGAKFSVCLLIGGEGGFTEAEIGISLAHQFQPVTLGRRILRSETAALYAASVTMAILDG